MSGKLRKEALELWRWIVPKKVRDGISWLRRAPGNSIRRVVPPAVHDWLSWLSRGHRIGRQSNLRTDWDIPLSLAGKKYFEGARYLDLQPHFETVAQLQDQWSSSKGLDWLSFRIVGPKHWGANIGHLSLLDVLAKLKILDELTEEVRILSFEPGTVSNSHYFDYISKLFPSIYLDEDEYATFTHSTHSLQESVSFFRLRSGISLLYPAVSLAHRGWQDRDPLLRLSEEDCQWGKEELSRICYRDVDWFVTFHIRTGGDTIRSASNSDVRDYISAMKAVVDCGGVAVRIGGEEMPALPKVQGVVDYAQVKPQSPRMNTFLMAECRFFVGTASGPLTVPHTFGVPTLYTNAPAVGLVPDFPKTLTMPKKYAEESSGRVLHLQELVDSPVAYTVNPLADQLLRAIPNTSEELRQGTLEMVNLTASQPLQWPNMSSEQRSIYQNLRQSIGDYSGVRLPGSYISSNWKNFI